VSTNVINVHSGPTTPPLQRGTDATRERSRLPYLPGRTITDGHSTGIVVEADADACTVRWPEGITERMPTASLRAVNPDRPTLAHDELFVSALGENLAQRSGAEALAGFHQGWNNGRVAFTEAARRVLAGLDERALAAKHAACSYSYVVDPDGIRRQDRGEFLDGDRLVTCPFFADGPNSGLYCGAHYPGVVDGSNRSSIFYALPEQYASGEAIVRSPFEPMFQAVA
jgi:hypothetical protein